MGDAPHSGVREALLAPMAAPALPDVGRSSSCVREEKRKSSSPTGCFEFWWARRPPSLSYGSADRGGSALPLPFKNQNSTFINRQFFLCHAVGDKSADHGGSALPSSHQKSKFNIHQSTILSLPRRFLPMQRHLYSCGATHPFRFR